MKHIKEELENLVEQIIGAKVVATSEAIEEADEARAAAEPELTKFTLPNAYDRHLVDFLQSEKEAFEGGETDDPLCSCANPYCSLKRGELPAVVRMNDDTETGIRQFREGHDGDARVLTDAREDWIEKGSEVKRHLEDTLSILRRATTAQEGDV